MHRSILNTNAQQLKDEDYYCYGVSGYRAHVIFESAAS